jgi:hypothetical protein
VVGEALVESYEHIASRSQDGMPQVIAVTTPWEPELDLSRISDHLTEDL